jgi:hypothetical protein
MSSLQGRLLKNSSQGVDDQCTFVSCSIFVDYEKRKLENCDWSLIFALHVNFMLRSLADYSNILNKIFSLSAPLSSLLNTYFFSRLPAPVSRNPLAKGLLSIFNCVICG